MKDVASFRKQEDGFFEENHGVYYDEFDVGDMIRHRPGRTITEADNIWMSLLCLNTHPLHIDANYGEDSEFGQCIVSSLITLSIVGGLSTNGTSAKAVANLGWSEIKLVAPVFVGDTIYAETNVVSKRPSASRPGFGIVTFETFGKKREGGVFLSFVRSALIPFSPS